MRGLRFALALLALALGTEQGLAQDPSDSCPNAFYSSEFGTCGMTGRVSGCVCEYHCSYGTFWFNFCSVQ